MNSIDAFLVQYGLAAIFVIMLAKSAGVPIPIPGDLIILTAAARAAEGKLSPVLACAAILLALVSGGLFQYLLARSPGRKVLYRFGRFIGLTPPRLDAAALKVKKGGALAVGVAILLPGVRGVAIVASGLADLPLNIFGPSLVLGSAAFLALHFFLGFLGGSLLIVIGRILPLPEVIALVLVLFVIVFVLWLIAFRSQKSARSEVEGAPVELWHEGICPVCLALYTADQLRTPLIQGL